MRDEKIRDLLRHSAQKSVSAGVTFSYIYLRGRFVELFHVSPVCVVVTCIYDFET